MPELPEVECARKSLDATVVGKMIAAVNILRPTVVRTPGPRQFTSALIGQRVLRVRRQGKALLFELHRGWTLVFRFMLWGLIRVHRGPAGPDPQTAVIIAFRDSMWVEFRELQLSSFALYRAPELRKDRFLATLGTDPLSSEFTRERFAALCGARGTVRAILTDQQQLAGIGNLWAHEILHGARLRPDRAVASLSESERRGLYQAIGRVLRAAIRQGGEPDFIDAQGRRGRYRLAVYGRGGQRCPRGDGIIRASRLGGRPSFFCPACQR